MGEAGDTSVDMWSCGVVLYILVCGFPPFWQENLDDLAKSICACAYDYPSPDCDSVSATARNAIAALIELDPESRATAASMQGTLQAWMRAAPSEGEGGPRKARQRHSEAVARLRRAAFGIIAQQRMGRMIQERRNASSPIVSSTQVTESSVHSTSAYGAPNVAVVGAT